MPFFSVIIPVYNRQKYLHRGLDSLKNQTFKDFEIIIIDDASTDNSLAIANLFDWPYKQIIHNKANQERCISRNKGIAVAKGEYICFLDSDDYHLPHHLEAIHNAITVKDFPKAFFFTNAWDETEEGFRSERTCPDFEVYDPYYYFLTYTVNPQRWAVHRDIMSQNLFDPEITICEDMDTSLRMLASGVEVHQIKERTTVYVAAPDSFTHGNPEKPAKELLYLNKIFKKAELRDKLPKKAKRRLLSMCHYHLSNRSNQIKDRKKTFYHGFKSFFLYPKGYNGKTNKILFVSLIYAIPYFGNLLRFLVRSTKLSV